MVEVCWQYNAWALNEALTLSSFGANFHKFFLLVVYLDNNFVESVVTCERIEEAMYQFWWCIVLLLLRNLAEALAGKEGKCWIADLRATDWSLNLRGTYT